MKEDHFSQLDDHFSQLDDHFSQLDDHFSQLDDHFSQLDDYDKPFCGQQYTHGKLTEFEPCCAKIPLILIPTSCVGPDPDVSEGLYDVISNLGRNYNRYKHGNTLKLTGRKFSVSSEVCAMLRFLAAAPVEIRHVFRCCFWYFNLAHCPLRCAWSYEYTDVCAGLN